jgi:hypothetical protein
MDISWRKLRNDEIYSLYSSPNIFRVIKSSMTMWAGYVARMGEGRNVYKVLVGRPEVKRLLGRPRRRWKDIGIDVANWLRIGSSGGLLSAR